VFGQHDLATDRSFNEFNVVLCRNVMLQFSRELEQRVHGLLHESLCRLGIRGWGRAVAARQRHRSATRRSTPSTGSSGGG
jgi:chemotaxis protein methyltransferase CheR